MKKFIPVFISLIMLLSAFSFTVQAETAVEKKEYVVSAYVTPWNWSGVPDPTKVNIINYSFATIDISTHEVIFNNSRDIYYLSQILALKQENPDLKVLISIGGAGADGFSQAAKTEESREIFAQSTLDLINKYGLDGVDIDWENPVNGGWGTITAIPEDRHNCTLLMQAIREKIGDDKLITFADGVTNEFATWVEYPELNKYIDYFNMMSYCFASGAGRKHDSNLYPSPLAAWGGINGVSAHGGVNMHLRNGIPAEKIIMGVPFYGVNFEQSNATPKYGQMVALAQRDGYSVAWDDMAKANYIVNNSTSEIAAVFESPDSIFHKSNYIKDRGLGGMMYWEYGQDDSDGTLRTTAWESLNGTPACVFKINARQTYHHIFGAADCNVPFLTSEGRAMLPLRICSNVIGSESCLWNEADKSISLKFKDFSFAFTIDSTEILLKDSGGTVIDRSTLPDNEIPKIIDGNTYLPLRALAAITDKSVKYKENEHGGFVVFSFSPLTESELDAYILSADKKITY